MVNPDEIEENKELEGAIVFLVSAIKESGKESKAGNFVRYESVFPAF